MGSGMPIEIRQHAPGSNVRDFIRAGHVVFERDPSWVPPLDLEINERLHPNKNPFFKRAEVMLFTAWRNGRLVGRCSATIDREHLRIWKDDTGFFGFLDTIDDEELARALLRAAEEWLRARGMKRAIGPMSLYANDEIGILIEGFDSPPVLMMGHSGPYQGGLVEKCGYEKEKDLWCWKYTRDTEFRPRALKA